MGSAGHIGFGACCNLNLARGLEAKRVAGLDSDETQRCLARHLPPTLAAGAVSIVQEDSRV